MIPWLAAVLALGLQVAAATGAPADDDRAEIVSRLELADRAFAAERWSEARGHYEALLPLLPTPLTVTIHQQLARCHSNAGEFAQALEHLQVLLDRDPQDMALRALMASEAIRGGLTERGQALLRSLDEARISDPRVYFDVGLLFVNRGDASAAERYFGRALELDPAFVDAWFQRGFVRLQLQRWAGARGDFERVVALARPDTIQASTAKKALASLP